LRDYLFFPLGGSRGSFWLVARNLLIVMTLCGLWHGAAWNFVLFGLLQGVLLLGHKLFRDASRDTSLAAVLTTRAGTLTRVLFTFVLFSISLVVFRSPTLAGTVKMFGRLFTSQPGLPEPLKAGGLLLTVVLVLLMDLLQPLSLRRLAERAPPVLLGGVYASVLCLVLLFAPITAPPFIYFQF
jgi:alginate O-acetyltransferase complex protein AlgI